MMGQFDQEKQLEENWTQFASRSFNVPVCLVKSEHNWT